MITSLNLFAKVPKAGHLLAECVSNVFLAKHLTNHLADPEVP
jgi:hypothetical protein